VEEQRPSAGGKPFAISEEEVRQAYLRVRANDGAAGADGKTLEMFAKDQENELYKVWNRMSSGSYFPPPVRGVEIPKAHGRGKRLLGIPAVADRVAQTVVAARIEAAAEPVSRPGSYGYRPGRSPLDAVAACRENCWRHDWVIDLDIRAFFDSVPWDLIIKAVQALPGLPPWVLLYVKRWLAAPVVMPDGTLAERDRGTPQGSPVSPVLANLFMHWAFDTWLDRNFPGCPYERFADDAVVHCRTRQQAGDVLAALRARMNEVGLELHPDKTMIVYCRDANRRQRWDGPDRFTFLGYEFRARTARNKHGRLFDGFAPAISPQALAAKRDIVRSWKLGRRTAAWDLKDIRDLVNPAVTGWMQYYGQYNRHELHPLLRLINHRIQRWMRAKYRKLRPVTALRRVWKRITGQYPAMFTHWQWVTTSNW
jgi:RNA-directed DNA polymerase